MVYPHTEMTAAMLAADRWDAGLTAQMTFHQNGVVQIGGGTTDQWVADARYPDAGGAVNALLTMDMLIYCPGRLMLDVDHHVSRGMGRLLLPVTAAEDAGYYLEYRDGNEGGLRWLAGTYRGEEFTPLVDEVNAEAQFVPYGFNRLQFGLFDRDGGVRLVLYFNHRLLFDGSVTAEGTFRPPVSLRFCCGGSTLLLRGVDSAAGLPEGYAVPRPAGTVGQIQTWDISGLRDYDFRCLATVMEPRTWYDSNGVKLPYRLYLPTHYTPDKAYPLAMYLHGSGVNGTDNGMQLGGDVAFHKAFLDYQRTEEFIYVVPQCPADNWNTNDYNIHIVLSTPDFPIRTAGVEESPEGAALRHLLTALTREFSVDESRMYIAGASAGGQGAYGLMGRYPDLFAGAIVGCAAGDTSLAAHYSPIVIGHGALDPAIAVARGREMRDAVSAAGGTVRYYEFSDRYHDFCRREEILDWITWIFGFKN